MLYASAPSTRPVLGLGRNSVEKDTASPYSMVPLKQESLDTSIPSNTLKKL